MVWGFAGGLGYSLPEFMNFIFWGEDHFLEGNMKLGPFFGPSTQPVRVWGSGPSLRRRRLWGKGRRHREGRKTRTRTGRKFLRPTRWAYPPITEPHRRLLEDYCPFGEAPDRPLPELLDRK